MATTTLPSLQEMLAQAQLAYHRLNTGTQFVRVTAANGYTTEFTPATVDKLSAYIQQLQEQIAGTQTRGAIGVVF
jgi:hypothetical protein